ncbi:MAG: hypothetical protein AAGA05_12215 [Pseudomonadota bacterium]
MRHLLIPLALCALMAAVPAHAADCFADYKAKQDDPLRLHYGVAEISGDCTKRAARGQLTPRLARDGWTLLNVMTVFGPDGLSERKANAGQYYLRY